MIKEKYDIPDNPQSSTISKPISPPIPKSKPVDPFEPLKGKFHKGEIELIKQIFNSFTDNCPIAQKKLIEELKKKVIKDLSK